MYNKRSIGADKELLATKYLKERNYTILEQNYYTRHGEIDIIATNDGYIAFIEVKYRSNTKIGFPEEAVNVRKQQSIIAAAKYYLYRHGISFDTPCRFDVLVILKDTITLYKQAFDTTTYYS